MLPDMHSLPARGFLCPMLPGTSPLLVRGLCPMLPGTNALLKRGWCPMLPSPGTLRGGTLRRLRRVRRRLRQPGIATVWRSLGTMYCTAFDA